MKKIFTSVMAALCLAAPVGNLSAQTSQQFTKSQEEAIKKELLPVVFEQIKEQAGIDILGWATPKLNANTISGIPILESSNLLRAGETEVRVTPDSIISTLQGQKLKIVFKDQDAKYLPIEVLGDKQLVIDLPAEINVFVGEANFMNLYFNSELVKGGIFGMLPSFSLNAKFTLGDSEKMDLLSASLIQGKTSIDANFALSDQVKGLLGLASSMLPESIVSALKMDYLVQIDLLKLSMDPLGIPLSLYGISGEQKIPMGDAFVNVDLTAMSMPIKSADITSYENGSANKWDRYTFALNQETEQDLVLGIDKYECEKDFSDAGKYSESTIITMTDYTKNMTADTKSAISGIVTRVVNELANDGQASMYKMTIEQGNKNVENGLKTELEVEVVPYMSEDKKSPIAEIRINTYEDGTAIPMLIKATADLTGSQKIAVDVIQNETTYATAYFTSNILGAVTSNESVQVTDVKVIPMANAIRVLNADKASYQIYSISGAMMANGTIAGDAYISTANLAKGIYIVVVEANGVKQAVKFVR